MQNVDVLKFSNCHIKKCVIFSTKAQIKKIVTVLQKFQDFMIVDRLVHLAKQVSVTFMGPDTQSVKHLNSHKNVCHNNKVSSMTLRKMK